MSCHTQILCTHTTHTHNTHLHTHTQTHTHTHTYNTQCTLNTYIHNRHTYTHTCTHNRHARTHTIKTITQHSTCTNDPTIAAVRLPNICKDPMTPEANPTDTSP